MNPDGAVSEIAIHDQVCKEAGVSLQWCGSSKLVVFPSRQKEGNINDEHPSPWAPCESIVYEINQDCILYNDELRKLVHETCGSFISSRQPLPEVDSRAWVLSLSHEHRSTIRQCIENLQIAVIKCKDEKYNDWAEMFDDVEILWHLCELLHMDVVPAEIVLPRLLEWMQFQSGDLEMKVSEMLADSETRGAEQRFLGYWDVVIKLLLNGRFEACRALLMLHSHAVTSPFLEADNLLRAIPVYTVFCGLTISEFNSRWRSWKSAVRTKIKSAKFESHPKLLFLMKILAAEELPMKELKPYCDKWYNLMISALIFIDPTVKIYELNDYSKSFIAEYGGLKELKQFDYTILAIFDSDLNSVITKLQNLTDGGWSAVHLGNLLYLSSFYDKVKNPNGVVKENLEALFLDYGQQLMSHSSMWQVGIRYVSQCTFRKDALTSLLEKIPIDNEKKALRIVSTAKELGLNSLAESICRMMAMRCLKNSETGNTLTWVLLSSSSEFASEIADHYLQRYTLEGDILEFKDTLMHLGQSNLTSARLTFLAKYCEFHELYAEGEIREAALLLIRLIDSKVAPKSFWLTLLTDAIPLLLLPTNTPIFSQDDTTVLSACLEELSTNLAENLIIKKSDFTQKTQALRMAIAKNLARTLILESCPPPSDRIIKCYKQN